MHGIKSVSVCSVLEWSARRFRTSSFMTLRDWSATICRVRDPQDLHPQSEGKKVVFQAPVIIHDESGRSYRSIRASRSLSKFLDFNAQAELATFRDYILRAFRTASPSSRPTRRCWPGSAKRLWAAAKKHGQQLRFEACVGGGIPVIRSLTESFAVEEARSNLWYRQRHLQLHPFANGKER